jgi:glycerophosphoryl diester phosphodiesterase
MTIKIAHRGYCGKSNANTLESIKDSIKYGFDMIELDVQLDRDNQIILYHDIHYKNKLIKDMSYAELVSKQPDVVTLSTVMRVIDYKNCKIYLDLKGSNILASMLDLFFIENNINTTNIWLASFNLNHIHYLSNTTKKYNLGLITSNNYTFSLLSIITNNYSLSFIAFDWTMLNYNTVQFLQNMNVSVFVYTISTYEQLEFIKTYRVDGIISDILL